MASFDSIWIPKGRGTRAQPAATTSTAEIVFYENALFAITCSGRCTIRFGRESMSAADATDFALPADTTSVWDCGKEWDRIRVFNTTGSAIDVHTIPLSRT